MDLGLVNFLVAIVVATLWAMDKDPVLPGKNGKLIRFFLGLGFGLIQIINILVVLFEIEEAIRKH